MRMLSKNLPRELIACQCGCDTIGGYPENLDRLVSCIEKLIELSPGKIVITSAYRCPEHNDRPQDEKNERGIYGAGGVKNSYHTQCLAVDFWIPGTGLDKAGRLARKAGFTGIGRYWNDGFVHADFGKKRTWDE